MKDTICFIETEDKKYPLVFNLNVMEDIQEKYGSMDKWGSAVQGDGEPNIKTLKAGLMAMINEGIDILNEKSEEKMPFVTEKQVGRIVSEVGINKICDAIKDVTVKSTKTGDEEKNG